jgi:hypothetical protein
MEPNIPRLFNSDYTHHQVYGTVTAIEFVQDIDRYAYRQGLYVIRQYRGGGVMASSE